MLKQTSSKLIKKRTLKERCFKLFCRSLTYIYILIIGLFGFIIINSGRITVQKRQDLLIKSFAVVNAKFPETRLVILGKGNSNELFMLAKELGVENFIFFAGFQTPVFRFYLFTNLGCTRQG